MIVNSCATSDLDPGRGAITRIFNYSGSGSETGIDFKLNSSRSDKNEEERMKDDTEETDTAEEMDVDPNMSDAKDLAANETTSETKVS